jgi:hypothetical protein
MDIVHRLLNPIFISRDRDYDDGTCWKGVIIDKYYKIWYNRIL